MSLIIINLLAVFFGGMLYAVTCVQVESLGEGDTVVLYLHGNSFNRSQSHRLGLYTLLLKLGYHVLAIGRVFRLIEKKSLKP
jgi:hypothetical protein